MPASNRFQLIDLKKSCFFTSSAPLRPDRQPSLSFGFFRRSCTRERKRTEENGKVITDDNENAMIGDREEENDDEQVMKPVTVVKPIS